METHKGLTVALVTAVVLSATGVTGAAAQQGTDVQLSETLAELNTLGLRVEVRPTGAATGVPSAPVIALPGAGALSEEETQTPLDRAWAALGNLFSSSVDRMRDEAIDGIRAACRVNAVAGAGVPLELASVTISLGVVTVTFVPTTGFCEAVIEAEG